MVLTLVVTAMQVTFAQQALALSKLVQLVNSALKTSLLPFLEIAQRGTIVVVEHLKNIQLMMLLKVVIYVQLGTIVRWDQVLLLFVQQELISQMKVLLQMMIVLTVHQVTIVALQVDLHQMVNVQQDSSVKVEIHHQPLLLQYVLQATTVQLEAPNRFFVMKPTIKGQLVKVHAQHVQLEITVLRVTLNKLVRQVTIVQVATK